MNELEKKINYQFKDKDLLKRALTHSSSKTRKNQEDNERLEFLGDRVLGLIVAERLLEKFPSEKEGDIAKRHTGFVCKEQLVEIAKKINIEKHITKHVNKNDDNDSILADSIEALLGAIYTDSSIEEDKNFIDAFWDFDANIEPPVDAKTALQEWAQGKKLGLPTYKLIAQSGTDHHPVFKIEVSIKDYSPKIGEGKNKKEAQKSAAEKFLKANI